MAQVSPSFAASAAAAYPHTGLAHHGRGGSQLRESPLVEPPEKDIATRSWTLPLRAYLRIPLDLA